MNPNDYFHYDPETGVLIWREGQRHAGKPAGTRTTTLQGKTYLLVKVNGTQFYVHRVIIKLMTGEWPTEWVDHVNGDGTDNRWVNLRPASRHQNAQNRKIDTRNTTGVTGVTWNSRKGKYKAEVQAYGQREFLGYHENKEDAEAVVLKRKSELHGQFMTKGS